MSGNEKIIKKQNKTDIEEKVMSKILNNEVKMKPKWYFVLGSLLTSIGLIGITIGAIFLLNIFIFLIRKKGPGIMKLQLMIYNFPWWIPILALFFIIIGIWLLKKYDFSYKKNFLFIIISFILIIFISAFIINQMGFNEFLLKHKHGKRIYHHFKILNEINPRYYYKN